MDEIFKTLINFGVLGFIAWLFFKDYVESKKHHQEFSEKQIEHEKSFIVVIENNTKAIEFNNSALTYTKAVHDEMDDKLNLAIKSIEALKIEVGENQSKGEETTRRILDKLDSFQTQLRSMKE